jgi:beta-phosphoglucomutase-like phosphatase (HAD superfamily)
MLGAKPGECVAFEDSESGCMSAKNAGMKIVLVESRVPPEGCDVMMVVKDFAGLKADDVLRRAGI